MHLTLMTGVMSPPSGIVTAMATLTCSLYVMPLPSAVHAAHDTTGSLSVTQIYWINRHEHLAA